MSATEVRTLQVVYGYMARKLSRKRTERFIMLDAADRGLEVPQSPLANFWCREAPDGAPMPWMIGWTAPSLVRNTERAVKAINDERLIPFTTHESNAARGAIVN